MVLIKNLTKEFLAKYEIVFHDNTTEKRSITIFAKEEKEAYFIAQKKEYFQKISKEFSKIVNEVILEKIEEI